MVSKLGYQIYATEHTCDFIEKHGLEAIKVYKFHEEKEPNIKTLLENKKNNLVINITDHFFKKEIEDDYMIKKIRYRLQCSFIDRAESVPVVYCCFKQDKKQRNKIKNQISTRIFQIKISFILFNNVQFFTALWAFPIFVIAMDNIAGSVNTEGIASWTEGVF